MSSLEQLELIREFGRESYREGLLQGSQRQWDAFAACQGGGIWPLTGLGLGSALTDAYLGAQNCVFHTCYYFGGVSESSR